MARYLTSDEKDGISGWEVVKQSKVPVFWLYYYYPQSVEDVSDEQEDVRQLIYDFKNGKNSDKIAEQVSEVLKHFFLEETLSDMTFVCIPASTEKKTKRRFEDFSSSVCSECDMWNGLDYIDFQYDREAKHIGGEEDFDNLDFDEDFFDGKRVILFDDICTRGNSIANMKRQLESLGAIVIGAITLGRTVHNDRGDDPYYMMNTTPKRRRTSKKATSRAANSSAEESSQLYNNGYSVEEIADERGLAESTILNHLFTTQDLDPYDYISNSQLNKATRVMNAGNYERLGDALGEFLDYEEKAAFYYLKNNGLL